MRNTVRYLEQELHPSPRSAPSTHRVEKGRWSNFKPIPAYLSIPEVSTSEPERAPLRRQHHARISACSRAPPERLEHRSYGRWSRSLPTNVLTDLSGPWVSGLHIGHYRSNMPSHAWYLNWGQMLRYLPTALGNARLLLEMQKQVLCISHMWQDL